MKYEQGYDNEWFPIKNRSNQKFMCCDCGLVHVTKFKLKGNILYAQFTRDNRATAAARRKYR